MSRQDGSFWSYRLVQFDDKEGPFFKVCEVFFRDHKPYARNDGAIICGDTIEEANGVRVMMLDAFKRPPINDTVFGAPTSDSAVTKSEEA